MSGLKTNGFCRFYFILALCLFVCLGLMVSSQAMAGWTLSQESAVLFDGAWTSCVAPTCSSASGGSLKYSNDLTGSASFTFSGNSIHWIGYKDVDLGISEVRIDGVKYAEVDLYASSPHWQQLLFSASGLQSGTHTITIKPTNQKNTSSTGYYTAVDAFDVYESSFSFIDPNNNDLWDIQVGHLVRLAINYKLGTSQYRLYRKCGLDTWSTSNMITLRACDYYGVCPSYTWLPPLITGQYTVLPCQLAAQLLDSNFKVIDTAISDIFGLEPPEGIAGFSISPLSPDVAGGGSQVFTINGGVPPYTVGTLLNLPVNPGISQLQENYDVTAFQHCSTSTNIICAADGDCPAGPPAETCVTTAGRLHLPSTHTFKIKNSGSCTQVVIVAQDSTKSRTSALYNISCP